MKSSLVESVEHHLLEKWLREYLTIQQYKELWNRSSVTLLEAICALLYKDPWAELEDTTSYGMLKQKIEAVCKEVESMSDTEVDVDMWREIVKRLLRYYVMAHIDIEGGVLKAKPRQATFQGRNITRYHLQPKIFIAWAKKNKILTYRKRGPKDDSERKKAIGQLAAFSQTPERLGKITAREIVNLESAQTILKTMLEQFPEKVHDTKLERIVREIRNHDLFLGKINNTGPKKSRKSKQK